MSNDINPYAPPSASSADPAFPPPNFAAAPPQFSPFSDPSVPATVTSILMGLTVLANLAIVAILGVTISLLQKMADGHQPTQAEIDADTLRIGAGQVALIAARLMAVGAFLVWTYRVAANLPALRAPRQETSPGWAVGFYFIPIMNLFKPFQAIVEVWKGSDPARYTKDALSEQGTTLLGFWWAAHILAIIGQRIATVTGNNPTPSPQELITQNILALAIILLLEVPRDVMSILIVRRLSQNQLTRHALVEESEARGTSTFGPVFPH